MKRVGIIGASGYAGFELIKILSKHKDVQVEVLNSKSFEGKKVNALYKDFDQDLTFTNYSIEEINKMSLDLVFLALPHTISMKTVPKLNTKIVDLSADYRFSDYRVYEKVYGVKHEDKERRAVFGIPEMFREEIKKADIVANPGCYVTACLLSALPIQEYANNFIFDCKSGFSGAGRESVYAKDRSVLKENVIAYNIAKHRHKYEIEQFVKPKVGFTPHIIDSFRGIMATTHVSLKDSVDAKKVFKDFYKGEEFVKVVETIPSFREVQNTNSCIIGGFEKDENNQLVIVSILDNLMKGASGQAVQNMNLMLGLKETEGLI